jgi:hypothetical protein
MNIGNFPTHADDTISVSPANAGNMLIDVLQI